jgi:hypothetical protein
LETVYKRLAITAGFIALLGAGFYWYRSLPEHVGPYHMGNR